AATSAAPAAMAAATAASLGLALIRVDPTPRGVRALPKLATMAGHSKWAQIKHKKAVTDARRGAEFTKLARAIQVAARDGGGDPAGNASLANANQKGEDAGMA